MKVFLPLLLAIANGMALAQGPIAPDLEPLKYKLLFENEKVRVIEEHLKAHEKEPMHSHPYGVFACFLTDAHISSISRHRTRDLYETVANNQPSLT